MIELGIETDSTEASNWPCNTENETCSFDIETKLKKHTGSKEPYGARATSSQYLHDTHERNLAANDRIAAETDQAIFQGRAILGKYEEERSTSETSQEHVIRAEKETMDSQSLLQNYMVGQDTSRSFPSLSDETVPVRWADSSTIPLRSHAKGDVAKCKRGELLARW